MRFPNKITSLKESVVGKSLVILATLESKDLSVVELFNETKGTFNFFLDFLDCLDFLFALGKITLIIGKDLLHYVK